MKDSPDRQAKKITVAVKTIKKYNSKEAAEDFLREMSVMTKFVHPNVIKMYGLVQQGEMLKIYNNTKLAVCINVLLPSTLTYQNRPSRALK